VHFAVFQAAVSLLKPPLYSRACPRMRRASCMSRGIMVTRLAWMAHRFLWEGEGGE
jgi:hypothetical protein